MPGRWLAVQAINTLNSINITTLNSINIATMTINATINNNEIATITINPTTNTTITTCAVITINGTITMYAGITINATIKANTTFNTTMTINPTATLSPTVPRVLLSLLFPGHTIFVFVIFAVEIEDLPSPAFLIFYLIAAVIQVCFFPPSKWSKAI